MDRKIAIVTGGSQGIGYHIAHQLLFDGFFVFILARTKSRVESAVLKLREKFPNVEGVVCDVSDWNSVKSFADDLINRFENVIVLVNNAGVQTPIGKVHEVKREDWYFNIKVNLVGTFNFIYAFIPVMVRQGYGKIINLSGGGSTGSRPYFSAYAVAKTGIVRLTEILADEYREYNIDVNAVSPGAINTRMLDEVIEHGNKHFNPEYVDALRRKKEGGHSPEHVARLVSFLASSKSDGISGKLISAIWDPWWDESFQKKLRESKNFATLRRIDDKYYREV